MPTEPSKDSLRREAILARAHLSPAVWEQVATGIVTAASLPDDTGAVALYASRPDEPPTGLLIDALVARGVRVLLPVLRREPDWGWFAGWDAMVPGWGGIPQPTGPRCGAAAILEVDVAIIPCLAVGRDGNRLGTGGGWYDRALPLLRPGVPIWAVARHDEVRDSVPAQPHDVPVDAALTEIGLLPLATRTG